MRRIEPRGVLAGDAAEDVKRIISEIVLHEQVDELHVSLADVTALGDSGVDALLAVYVLAIEHGVRYRVVDDAEHHRRALRWPLLLDVLADSDDVGTLIFALAVLRPSAFVGSPR
ncbi:hypothetical protein [Actinoplanes awajinensis]|uniref:STAS domain-containing protein n=1 Tax=Actinoplanes awajinensis subsp. mycoplanecinus TaxID=135947 RepID=A0A117MPZ3_9ACTN|nr:hypothetical protein [Actinoplanes awajinensis]KUL29441.1 hypothetical protein ADL15_27885 [Actinoplanes awajinensis subsp. mycoplanecinus]